MDNRKQFFVGKVRLGWALLAIGALIVGVGIIMEITYDESPYNVKIITGLGILLAGMGIGNLVRYQGALKDEKAAKQLLVQERDERTMLIRMRAGNRAYWVSAALVYAGLMWASFAANGDLPPLTGDTLWYYLAATFIIPFGAYAGSILIDERIS